MKLGIDPTIPHLHLGHAVPLMKLREFQQAGHTAVLIIGDWTARIGDPSGKDETRPNLSAQEVTRNAKEFFRQANLILDKKKTEIHLQSEWYKNFKLEQIIHLTAVVSVGEMLSHETFRKRLRENLPFSLHELLYPLLQGYDSVAVRADVELGAVEQKFNLLMGRKIQRAFGQPQQDVILMPYLIGLDGKQKMSKSLRNFVALDDSADEMFGKIMSIPDGLIKHYFELCTNLSLAQIKKALSAVNPRDAKARLAFAVASFYHGEKQARAAQENFEKKFGKKSGAIRPDYVLKIKSGSHGLADVLVAARLAASKSEARRKIKEGAVEVDGRRIVDEKARINLKKGSLLRLGKRFARVG